MQRCYCVWQLLPHLALWHKRIGKEENESFAFASLFVSTHTSSTLRVFNVMSLLFSSQIYGSLSLHLIIYVLISFMLCVYAICSVALILSDNIIIWFVLMTCAIKESWKICMRLFPLTLVLGLTWFLTAFFQEFQSHTHIDLLLLSDDFKGKKWEKILENSFQVSLLHSAKIKYFFTTNQTVLYFALLPHMKRLFF